MPDHKFELLNAYLDGELNPQQRRKFEAHLEDCPECQQELESLESLSGMLAEAPMPEFPTPDQMAANVSLQLPRKAQGDAASPSRFDETWWLAPAGLLLMWLVISTVSFGANFFSAVSGINVAGNLPVGIGTTANYISVLGRAGLLEASKLEWLVVSETFIINIVWQVALALLYLSLIAIWWARHNSLELNPQFNN